MAGKTSDGGASDALRTALTWVAGAIAVGVLIAFLVIVAWLAYSADHPPRLADPAPTVPAVAGAGGELPPQARGAYDPSDNLMAVLAVVTPLLTTLVGFFFGQRAGEAGAKVAIGEAQQVNAEIERKLLEEPEKAGKALLDDLRSSGLIRGKR
jgi:hypothetical protein